MVLFDNMGTVALYTTLAVIVLVAYGIAGNPFAAGFDYLKNMVTSPRYLIHFVAMLAILVLNKNEMKIERNMDYHVNFTHWFHSLEGDLVANLQHLFHNPVLTTVLSFLYIVVFQAMLIASIFIYTYKSESKQMFYATCYAIMINYFVAIPFFLFFPVDEVWSYAPNVDFLMLDAFPKFETQYRALSGLNNCFPSLHTSISVTVAILAVRSGNKKWAALTCTMAVAIIFSIFYLGIHWFIDMCGGVVLGILASTIAIKLSQTNLLRLPDRLTSRPFAREELK
ncbi:phosphatase PAP2 family protein [Paenibacillus kobensis]|uniref:phosphatase PAP2 family protein n=1 Tax=Paenibacillus kobensis TaxID=59841 RepID=UPI000FDAC83D|nr:phosphatase PAP2 family protein [Paenibacillus kobensis]